MTKYTPIIGLEVHAELKTKSKMFCGCKNDPFGADKPNIYTCPVCLGMPGALPLPNQIAIDWTIKLGLALGCTINQFSKFDRKNYFYADLAKGYQISQYDIPFCINGLIKTSQGDIGITRIHLEEDTGKLIHDEINGEAVSLIDFNRSGVPLIEIVTEPDIINGEQAKEYGQKLRQILRYLNIADCKMAEGGLRLEANISLQKPDKTSLPPYKVEVKNINSFKFLEQAINYEIERQTKILDQGKVPVQETRGWNPNKGETFSQRTKEAAEDYRYFPDPDIPPIEISNEHLASIKNTIPELPAVKIERWQQEYQLETANAHQLTAERIRADWADDIFKLALKEKIKPNDLAKAIINKKIQTNIEEPAATVIKKYQQLHQTDSIDGDELNQIVQAVLTNNPDAVVKFKAGKVQIIGFLIGQIMQQAKKKLDPKLVRQILMSALEQTS